MLQQPSFSCSSASTGHLVDSDGCPLQSAGGESPMQARATYPSITSPSWSSNLIRSSRAQNPPKDITGSKAKGEHGEDQDGITNVPMQNHWTRKNDRMWGTATAPPARIDRNHLAGAMSMPSEEFTTDPVRPPVLGYYYAGSAVPVVPCSTSLISFPKAREGPLVFCVRCS